MTCSFTAKKWQRLEHLAIASGVVTMIEFLLFVKEYYNREHFIKEHTW